MLFDPKWEVQTKPDVFSLEGLILWLEKQPAQGSYRWEDTEGCLLFQYFTAEGFRVFSCGGTQFSYWSKGWWIFRSMRTEQFSRDFTNVAVVGPYTFGAALDRARKAAA